MDARNARRARLARNAGLMAALLCAAGPNASAEEARSPRVKKMTEKLQGLTPQKGHLEAHKDVTDLSRIELLGGPLEVEVSQDGDGVFVPLPAQRDLDEDVFGTPQMPRQFGGTPGMTGPPQVPRPQRRRVHEPEEKDALRRPIQGDAGGPARARAVDATVTDAAKTNDEIQFEAS